MLKRMIVATALFAAVCQPAFGVGTGITGVKDSADFAFKYEADVLPDAAGLGFVLVDDDNIFADSVSLFGGVLNINTNNNATTGDLIYYELLGGAGTNWDPSFLGDYTVEIRTIVHPSNSGSFGASLGQGDLNSSGFLSLFTDHVVVEGVNIPTAPNNDVFHTFRVTSIAGLNSADQVFRIYRDGVQIGSDAGQITNFRGPVLWLGDFVDIASEANFDIDYLRWDTTGAWEPPLPSLLDGDLNGDGFVGVDDLNIVLINWNQNVTPGDLGSGDPTGEGFVGVDDLNIVLVNWNNGTPPAEGAAIPEPASLALLGVGCMAVLRRRHSHLDGRSK